jgi:hypothetical protein
MSGRRQEASGSAIPSFQETPEQIAPHCGAVGGLHGTNSKMPLYGGRKAFGD